MVFITLYYKFKSIVYLINREQYYIDLKPEYNNLKVAGSRLGVKHSIETIAKIEG